MNNRYVLVVLGLLVLAATYYLIFVRVNRRNALVILGQQRYGTMDKKYLAAWATAVKGKQPNFEYNGKPYVTATGAAVK
jgi:hypothetical protein